MNEEQRHKVCQLIAGIVVSDEDLAPEEEAFVERLLARFGLDPDDRDVIFPLVGAAEAAAAMAELPEDVQSEAFSLLLEAAAADGQVVEEEVEYLRAVAEAIGIGDEELEARLARLQGAASG